MRHCHIWWKCTIGESIYTSKNHTKFLRVVSSIVYHLKKIDFCKYCILKPLYQGVNGMGGRRKILTHLALPCRTLSKVSLLPPLAGTVLASVNVRVTEGQKKEWLLTSLRTVSRKVNFAEFYLNDEITGKVKGENILSGHWVFIWTVHTYMNVRVTKTSLHWNYYYYLKR